MALRRRSRVSRRRVKPPIDGNPDTTANEEIDPAINAMIDHIRGQVLDDWGIFSTGAPATTQAKKPDGNYRTVPLNGTEEFTFCGLRLGKRGKMIFEFRPIDPTYTVFEWDEEKVFAAVKNGDRGSLEGHLAKALNPTSLMDGLDQPGDSFKLARSQFCARFRKAAAEEKKAEAVKEQKAVEERISDNPMFGMF